MNNVPHSDEYIDIKASKSFPPINKIDEYSIRKNTDNTINSLKKNSVINQGKPMFYVYFYYRSQS
jgi:hypothetical protein